MGRDGCQWAVASDGRGVFEAQLGFGAAAPGVHLQPSSEVKAAVPTFEKSRTESGIKGPKSDSLEFWALSEGQAQVAFCDTARRDGNIGEGKARGRCRGSERAGILELFDKSVGYRGG